MRFDDRTANGQAHAGALILGSVEGIKDFFRLLWHKPHAGIADRDQELTIVVLPGLDRKFTYSAHIFHGLNAIENQVHEYLLQLDTIGQDPGEMWAEVAVDRN